MKKLIPYLLSAVLLLAAGGAAQATSFTFESNDGSSTQRSDMNDLEHGYYYGWSIAGEKARQLAYEIDNGYHISSATFTYRNIYNWIYEKNDQLNTFLLSAPPSAPGSGKYTVGQYNEDGSQKGKTYYTYKNTVTNVKSGSLSTYTNKGYACTPTGARYTCVGTVTNTNANMTSSSTSKYEQQSSVFKQDQATIDGTGNVLSDNLWQRADQQSLDVINWGNGIDVTRIWDKEGDFLNPWHDPDGLSSKKKNVIYNFDSTLIGILTTYAGDGSFGFGIDPDCHYYNTGIIFDITTEKNPVPEPSTLLLLGAGLLGTVIMRKRAKK